PKKHVIIYEGYFNDLMIDTSKEYKVKIFTDDTFYLDDKGYKNKDYEYFTNDTFHLLTPSTEESSEDEIISETEKDTYIFKPDDVMINKIDIDDDHLIDL